MDKEKCTPPDSEWIKVSGSFDISTGNIIFTAPDGKGKYDIKVKNKVGEDIKERAFEYVKEKKSKWKKFAVKGKKDDSKKVGLKLGFKILNHLRRREVNKNDGVFEYTERGVPERDIIVIWAKVLDKDNNMVEGIGGKVKVRCTIKNENESLFLRLERGRVVEDPNPQERFINDKGSCFFYYRVGKGVSNHSLELDVVECDPLLEFEKDMY